MPEDILPYVDLEQLGQWYEDSHSGMFIGGCYVVYPAPSILRHNIYSFPEDEGWSVKMKLSSPTVPDGVWLRLPDYDVRMAEDSGEIAVALDALQVKSLDECTLLEAQCSLPEAGYLTEQYDSVRELVRDADNLGVILTEQEHSTAHWRDKSNAALEYEGCHTLRLALDISQNLSCYEWVVHNDLADFAVKHLRSCGVKEKLIQSGCIDLKGYAENLLETFGYMRASGEIGYLTRNGQEFIYEHTAAEESGMTMQ